MPLMRADPFASLISCDDQGLPYVTHLPLQLQGDAPCQEGESPVLLGHVARGNPHWRILQTRPQAVVTFLGAHAYLSPQVYPDLARVPTWNYLAVHCTVEATLIDEPEAKDALLNMEIAREESGAEVSQDLRDFTGLTPELIVKLADGGVHTLDDLADLAVDELTDLTGHTEEQARAIIMRAREHWFANEAASDA